MRIFVQIHIFLEIIWEIKSKWIFSDYFFSTLQLLHFIFIYLTNISVFWNFTILTYSILATIKKNSYQLINYIYLILHVILERSLKTLLLLLYCSQGKIRSIKNCEIYKLLQSSSQIISSRIPFFKNNSLTARWRSHK